MDYRSVILANLYGPGDNYHPENSYVILRSFVASMKPRWIYNKVLLPRAKVSWLGSCVYHSAEVMMQFSRWGNSLVVRFPAGLVQALDLKEGEEVDLHLVAEWFFEVSKKANPTSKRFWLGRTSFVAVSSRLSF